MFGLSRLFDKKKKKKEVKQRLSTKDVLELIDNEHVLSDIIPELAETYTEILPESKTEPLAEDPTTVEPSSTFNDCVNSSDYTSSFDSGSYDSGSFDSGGGCDCGGGGCD